MSAQKLTPIPFLVGLGIALHAAPVWAQATPTTPVMSFPTNNVEVVIDGQKKMQSDHLYINARQCLGSKYGEQDAGTAPETPDGTEDGGTTDAGTSEMPVRLRMLERRHGRRLWNSQEQGSRSCQQSHRRRRRTDSGHAEQPRGDPGQ